MRQLRIKNKQYGTVLRIIRVYARGEELMFRARDETYGGLCSLPVANYVIKKEWELVQEEE